MQQLRGTKRRTCANWDEGAWQAALEGQGQGQGQGNGGACDWAGGWGERGRGAAASNDDGSMGAGGALSACARTLRPRRGAAGPRGLHATSAARLGRRSAALGTSVCAVFVSAVPSIGSSSRKLGRVAAV